MSPLASTLYPFKQKFKYVALDTSASFQMSQPASRSIWKKIITNFVNSFKPRQLQGNYMGTDLFGNKFFEIPVNSSSSRSRPSRWFEPPVKDDFQSEMSSEWESWLRGR